MTEENTPSQHAKMIMEAINKEDVAFHMHDAYRLLTLADDLQEVTLSPRVLDCRTVVGSRMYVAIIS